MDKVTCPFCGDPHDLADMQVGFGKPDAWFAVPSDERERRVRLTDDLAQIDAAHHFVRGVLQIPVRGEPEPFGWGIWVRIDRDAFDQHAHAGEKGFPAIPSPSQGWIATQLPGFPQTLGVPVIVKPSADPNLRPTFDVTDDTHPLALEQRAGIPVERALEHLSRYLHAGEPEPRGRPHAATLAVDGWTLDDALQRFRGRDGVNWLPGPDQRQSIAIGEFAKMIFAIEASDLTGAPEVHRERMWVTVDAVIGTGPGVRYTGTLGNDPNVPGITRRGMRVWFGPEHVIDIGRTDGPATSELPDVLRCSHHGVSQETFVCQHLVRGTGLGFNQAEEDGDNPRPDAWCDACDRVLRQEGGWNERSEAIAVITLLCGACYDAAEKRNR